MKKVIYLSLCFLSLGVVTYRAVAITPPTDKHEFKTSYDINFDAERKPGEVVLHFQSAEFKNFDQLIVERSTEMNGSFAACKVIDLTELKLNSDYYSTSDKFPVSAKMDSYYRMKTISKEGIMKTYPPISINALVR